MIILYDVCVDVLYVVLWSRQRLANHTHMTHMLTYRERERQTDRGTSMSLCVYCLCVCVCVYCVCVGSDGLGGQGKALLPHLWRSAVGDRGRCDVM